MAATPRSLAPRPLLGLGSIVHPPHCGCIETDALATALGGLDADGRTNIATMTMIKRVTCVRFIVFAPHEIARKIFPYSWRREALYSYQRLYRSKLIEKQVPAQQRYRATILFPPLHHNGMSGNQSGYYFLSSYIHTNGEAKNLYGFKNSSSNEACPFVK
jgi:hypothetical protein